MDREIAGPSTHCGAPDKRKMVGYFGAMAACGRMFPVVLCGAWVRSITVFGLVTQQGRAGAEVSRSNTSAIGGVTDAQGVWLAGLVKKR